MTLLGAIKQLQELQNSEDMPIYYKPVIAEIINTLSMDAQEVKHGHWIVHKLGYSDDYYFECSHCHADDIYGDEYEDECDFEYCPRCGAIMDEEETK